MEIIIADALYVIKLNTNYNLVNPVLFNNY
jgi:hypothetical protein